MTKSQALISIVVLAIAAFAVASLNLFPHVSTTDLTLDPSLKKSIHTPPPLKQTTQSAAGELTVTGIFEATNTQRANNNISLLTLNEKLNNAAQSKLNDMFAQQYFEHTSPDGLGPSDVVSAAQYEYITVGENLALGTFESDSKLVQAWMNSPGHRENILSSKFKEIGIAVGKGQFNGEDTWLAVQTFGTSLSNCATPNPLLQKNFQNSSRELELSQEQLKQLDSSITQKINDIEALHTNGNAIAEQSNSLAKQGNNNISKGNEIYSETNSREQAQPYWDKGEAQQNEARSLMEEYMKIRDMITKEQDSLEKLYESHTKTVSTHNTQIEQTQKNADTYNQEVRAFNSCIDSFQ